jgi:hypothetical protein
MIKRASLYPVLIAVCICIRVSIAQSPVLSADIGLVASMIEKDFQSVDTIRTISMSDDQDGRFDFVVVGRKPHDSGWRVEILSATHHHVSRLWDSTVSVTEPEYSMSGPKNIAIQVKDYDYDVQLEGCAPHLCSNGVSGFLIFDGKEERTVKARVMSMDLNKAFTSTPKFDVQFSQNADEQSRTALMRMICQSSAIQNKGGLPFACRTP